MDTVDFLRFGLGFLATIALLVAAGLLARRYGGKFGLQPVESRRLRVVESLPLDARRRLVLARLDDEEHLLLLGVGSEACLTSRPAPLSARAETGR
ncbi:MAG: flagellar biosynthetic protein FliO [Maricaulaceae bacterium]